MLNMKKIMMNYKLKTMYELGYAHIYLTYDVAKDVSFGIQRDNLYIFCKTFEVMAENEKEISENEWKKFYKIVKKEFENLI